MDEGNAPGWPGSPGRWTSVPWRFNHKVRELQRGRTLRLDVLAPAVVRWSSDGWRTAVDTPTFDTRLGVHVADLPTERLGPGAEVAFTFRWPEADRWEGRDFSVRVCESRGHAVGQAAPDGPVAQARSR